MNLERCFGTTGSDRKYTNICENIIRITFDYHCNLHANDLFNTNFKSDENEIKFKVIKRNVCTVIYMIYFPRL